MLSSNFSKPLVRGTSLRHVICSRITCHFTVQSIRFTSQSRISRRSKNSNLLSDKSTKETSHDQRRSNVFDYLPQARAPCPNEVARGHCRNDGSGLQGSAGGLRGDCSTA